MMKFYFVYFKEWTVIIFKFLYWRLSYDMTFIIEKRDDIIG